MNKQRAKNKRRVRRIPVPKKPPKVEGSRKAYSRNKEKNEIRKDKDIE